MSFQVMLVVLCAIRKMMECIFTKRELRLLDDLLPEAGMNRRGRSHKKNKRHNSENLEADGENNPSPTRLMLKYEDPKKQKRIKELEKELESLYKNKRSSDGKAKAKSQPGPKQRTRTRKSSERSSSSPRTSRKKRDLTTR